MIKKIFTYYKIPLLISATIGIVVMAMGIVRNTWDIVEVALGIIMGTFILDIEYLLYPYLFEPNTDYARSVFAYIKHKDFGGLLGFINEHKNDIKDKSLNSALFQIILVPLIIFVIYSSASYFIKSLVLSAFANSIYRVIECYFEGNTKEWFWAIKGNPKKEGVIAYILILVIILVFCLWIL